MKDGILCNLMENNSSGLGRFKLQCLSQMPCNSLSLTVFIGCQPYYRSLLGCSLELCNHFLLVWRYLILRYKPVFYVYPQVLLGQITYMAETGTHRIVFSQYLLNSLCLCRRLDDY